MKIRSAVLRVDMLRPVGQMDMERLMGAFSKLFIAENDF
jgi:hypothetical protein